MRTKSFMENALTWCKVIMIKKAEPEGYVIKPDACPTDKIPENKSPFMIPCTIPGPCRDIFAGILTVLPVFCEWL
jgi:hypothetical protein